MICPFLNCHLSYNNRSSFSAHLSRKHPGFRLKPFKESSETCGISSECTSTDYNVNETTSESSNIVPISSKSVNESLALVCLRLSAKFHVSATALNIIVAQYYILCLKFFKSEKPEFQVLDLKKILIK